MVKVPTARNLNKKNVEAERRDTSKETVGGVGVFWGGVFLKKVVEGVGASIPAGPHSHGSGASSARAKEVFGLGRDGQSSGCISGTGRRHRSFLPIGVRSKLASKGRSHRKRHSRKRRGNAAATPNVCGGG